MSQMPRWYRKQWYEHKLGLDSLNAGYLDQADVQARRDAVEQQLDRGDRKYAQQQGRRTQSYLDQLTAPSTLINDKEK